MKSLILKDIYTIRHNAKSMLFILLVFAIVFLRSSGIQGYIFICAVLCAMMIVTTFSFDESSKWMSYAMIMPVSRNDLAAGKYIALYIFTMAGILFGLIAGVAGNAIIDAFLPSPEPAPAGRPLLLVAITALAISTVFGGISIPLSFRFGAEKGRILVLASFLIPSAICYAAYRLLNAIGIMVTDELITLFLYCSPAIGLIWNYGMYRISCAILAGKEFQ